MGISGMRYALHYLKQEARIDSLFIESIRGNAHWQLPTRECAAHRDNRN
jgi:hypothetical protein